MTSKDAIRIAVVLNGRFCRESRLLTTLADADYVIAADGGANWLNAHGRRPDLLIGDMDSIAADLLQQLEDAGCNIERHPAQKDETDAELALAAAAAMQPREIVILGALGGRIDHELANLSLLDMPQLEGISTQIDDGLSTVRLVKDGLVFAGAPGDIISLIPWGGDAGGVHTTGLEYALAGETLRFGPSRGISNVLVDRQARVSLESGRLLLIHTPSDEELNDA